MAGYSYGRPVEASCHCPGISALVRYTHQSETVVDVHRGWCVRYRCFERPEPPLEAPVSGYGATPLAACLCLIRFIKPPALMISRISGGYGLIWKV